MAALYFKLVTRQNQVGRHSDGRYFAAMFDVQVQVSWPVLAATSVGVSTMLPGALGTVDTAVTIPVVLAIVMPDTYLVAPGKL